MVVAMVATESCHKEKIVSLQLDSTSHASSGSLAIAVVLVLSTAILISFLLSTAVAAASAAAGTVPAADTAASADAAAAGEAAVRPTPGSFLLEEIQIEGNHRTGEKIVQLYLPLRPGDRVDQQALLDGVAELRKSELFARVEFYTRPGSERGRVVLVLEVQEKTIQFLLGTGNTNLEGWYLIPAALSFNNQLGRGERLDMAWKFGYRYTGLFLNFDQPRIGDGNSLWGLQAKVYDSDRIYFVTGVEYSQRVQRSGLDVYLGRRLGRHLTVALAAGVGRVDADSSATVYRTNESQEAYQGDPVPFEDLPPGIQAGVGQRNQSRLLLDLNVDSRSGVLAAGSPADGWWGKLLLGGTFQSQGSFGSATLDLRKYFRLGHTALAARFQVNAVGENAAFFDRLYLGGLYTVRGFPSQSLTRPAGDLWLWSTSLEYRAPLLGDPDLPRLAGLFFFDAGKSGSGKELFFDDISMGAGWGLKLRFWWIGWLGLDLGIPLTPSPVDQSFHLNASIGWSF
jgi:outer membrane protein assembly factor BamA